MKPNLPKGSAKRLLRVGLSACVAGAYFVFRPATPLPPLEVAMWYWHSPFRVTADEERALGQIGVKRMYVLDGTVTAQDETLRLIMPQTWRSRPKGIAIHLAFRLDSRALAFFKGSSTKAMADGLAPLLSGEIGRARRAGIAVEGVQLDMDVPTRLLKSYAALLRQTKRSLGPGMQLSATGLETWYGSDSVDELARSVDFLVPQCYEASTGSTLNSQRPISHAKGVGRVMERAAGLRRPYYVGLSTYGHALVFDQRGRGVGVYRDMSAREALRSPHFRLTRAFMSDMEGHPITTEAASGEEMLDLQTTSPDDYGRGDGYHVVYWLPTVESLRRSLAEVEKHRTGECRGVVLFRFPEPKKISALPLDTVGAALTHQAAQPDMRLRQDVRHEPWEAIEGMDGSADPARVIKLRVQNVGAASTSVRPDALVITLRLDRAGLESLDAADFDQVQAGFSAVSGSFEPCTLGRANVVRLTRFHCAANESLGAITMRPSAGLRRIKGEWAAVAGGQRVGGTLGTVEVGR